MIKIPFKINHEVYFANINEIILITRVGRKTTIYTKSKIIENYDSLQKIEGQLLENNFFRCHRSYIINIDMLREIQIHGRKTYEVKLSHIEETALMTCEKYKELMENQIYCGKCL